MIKLNPTQQKQADRDKINSLQLLAEIEIIIRKRFNHAVTDMEAKSWINIANEYQMFDLAAELGADLRSELNVDLN